MTSAESFRDDGEWSSLRGQNSTQDGPGNRAANSARALPPMHPEVHRMLPHPHPPRLDGAL